MIECGEMAPKNKYGQFKSGFCKFINADPRDFCLEYLLDFHFGTVDSGGHPHLIFPVSVKYPEK